MARDDGGPAFPVTEDVLADGMSLRDWCAITLAAGISRHLDNDHSDEILLGVARVAYRMADAMLKARNE